MLALMFAFTGCSDESAPYAPGGIGRPPGPITGGGGTGGMGGAGGSGGSGGSGGANGACDNDSDIAVIEGAAPSVRDVARNCGVITCALPALNGPAYQVCVNACVESSIPGLSTPCARCYGALERCGRDAICFESCSNNTCSTLCNDCLDAAGCIIDFEECRGLPGVDCPAP
jgi:hypothetical protein